MWKLVRLLQQVADLLEAIQPNVGSSPILEYAGAPVNGALGTGVGTGKKMLLDTVHFMLYVNTGTDANVQWVRFQRNEGVDE